MSSDTPVILDWHIHGPIMPEDRQALETILRALLEAANRFEGNYLSFQALRREEKEPVP